jgi:phage baseplate assembly protein V
MSWERVTNALKAEAGGRDFGLGAVRIGVVTNADPERYVVRVLIQPEGVLSGWLPVASLWLGAGWGLAALPVPGTQVVVLAQEHEGEEGIVVGALYSLTDPPPANTAGQFLLQHQSGAKIVLNDDGSISVNATTLAVSGNVSIAGSLAATGDVADGHGTLASLRADYDEHTHQVNGGVTSTPTPQN